MRIQFHIAKGDSTAFESSLEAIMLNVGNASKRITEIACKEVLAESLKQVPRDTGILASTAFYEVERNTGTKRYTYRGVVGYASKAGAGASRDRYNASSKAMVSDYALRVHEDLGAKHPNGGKAKFLEDPVRAYGATHFKRVAETNWRHAINKTGSGTQLTKI